MGVTAFTDGIYFINKYNTRCLSLGLLKQVSYAGCTHTHKHLYKIRTGQRKERHLCFSGYRLCKQSLTGTRRSHQKRTLRKLCTDTGIFPRIMQKVHHFRQRFLRFFLARHILKSDTGFLFYIYLCIAFPDTHHPAAAFAEHAEYKKHDTVNNCKHQYVAENRAEYGIGFIHRHTAVRHSCCLAPLLNLVPVFQNTGIIGYGKIRNRLVRRFRDNQNTSTVGIYLHFGNSSAI